MKILLLIFALLLVSCETIDQPRCKFGGDVREIVKNKIIYHNQIVSDYKLCVRNFPESSNKQCKEFAERINIADTTKYPKAYLELIEKDLKKCGEI
jgi:hypothetical protein